MRRCEKSWSVRRRPCRRCRHERRGYRARLASDLVWRTDLGVGRHGYSAFPVDAGWLATRRLAGGAHRLGGNGRGAGPQRPSAAGAWPGGSAKDALGRRRALGSMHDGRRLRARYLLPLVTAACRGGTRVSHGVHQFDHRSHGKVIVGHTARTISVGHRRRARQGRDRVGYGSGQALRRGLPSPASQTGEPDRDAGRARGGSRGSSPLGSG